MDSLRKTLGPQEEAGLFLGLEDCKWLFRRLKKEESYLNNLERQTLHSLEKILYSRLSIKEIEEL